MKRIVVHRGKRARGSAAPKRLRVAVVVPAAPDYRREPYLKLLERLGPGTALLAGQQGVDPTVETRICLPQLFVSPTIFLAGRRLAWQRRVVVPAARADAALLMLNPRFLSTWVVLFLRWLARRPTILWGHASSRGGSTRSSAAVRAFLLRLSSGVAVYTEAERDQLRRKHPRRTVVVAPNALLSRGEMTAVPPTRRNSLVVVGRLVEEKQPQLLLGAFAMARDSLPCDCELIVVGNGPLRASLERTARGIGGVRFEGHVDSHAVLRDIYARSITAVVPGTAGLSLIQAFGFGVPAIISDGLMHGPEIVAALEGFNAVFFAHGRAEELAGCIVEVVRTRESWLSRAPAISAACRDAYNAEAMVAALAGSVERCLGANVECDSVVAPVSTESVQ